MLILSCQGEEGTKNKVGGETGRKEAHAQVRKFSGTLKEPVMFSLSHPPKLGKPVTFKIHEFKTI